MDNNPYQTRNPSISDNPLLRIPQREALIELAAFVNSHEETREIGVVLPVGCGKSGCIAIAPFAFKASRTLVVAPSIQIASQLSGDFDPANPSMFYHKCKILENPPFPEPVEIRGTSTNRGDLEVADVVITNIQQLQGEENRWLTMLPNDFFDLILFDEGHHSVAATWEILKNHFSNANIVNFSATPLRADGQRMAGRIVYSYPIFSAIQEGYIKRLKAIVLNPRTLRYVRRENDQEIEVTLEEVRRLGEQDADFRRSIVTSEETLNTIVDASIRELDRIRDLTSNTRPKIIASALNYEHCRQIVEAYRARGRRADYVHSREDSAANQRVFQRLENHELDVIVQVKKLGEGFDHRYLSVAAVFSIFSNLSPFVQFVGRIMRVIVEDDTENPLNTGTVIFHAGANIAKRWEDFQQYSEADQEYFDQLLPMEGLDFENANDLEIQPSLSRRNEPRVEVTEQTEVRMEEIPLLMRDPAAANAIKILQDGGYTFEQIQQAMTLSPVPATRVRKRQAARAGLDMRIRNEVGRILGERNLKPKGFDLYSGSSRRRKGLRRDNFVMLKSAIDKNVNALVGRKARERHDFTQEELTKIDIHFDEVVHGVIREVIDAKTKISPQAD